jgi:hypothetical protein
MSMCVWCVRVTSREKKEEEEKKKKTGKKEQREHIFLQQKNITPSPTYELCRAPSDIASHIRPILISAPMIGCGSESIHA